MKKVLAILLVVGMMLALTACGKPFTCDFCGQEKSGKKHTADVYGDEMTICNDCYKDMEALVGN